MTEILRRCPSRRLLETDRESSADEARETVPSTAVTPPPPALGFVTGVLGTRWLWRRLSLDGRCRVVCHCTFDSPCRGVEVKNRNRSGWAVRLPCRSLREDVDRSENHNRIDSTSIGVLRIAIIRRSASATASWLSRARPVAEFPRYFRTADLPTCEHRLTAGHKRSETDSSETSLHGSDSSQTLPVYEPANQSHADS